MKLPNGRIPTLKVFSLNCVILYYHFYNGLQKIFVYLIMIESFVWVKRGISSNQYNLWRVRWEGTGVLKIEFSSFSFLLKKNLKATENINQSITKKTCLNACEIKFLNEFPKIGAAYSGGG